MSCFHQDFTSCWLIELRIRIFFRMKASPMRLIQCPVKSIEVSPLGFGSGLKHIRSKDISKRRHSSFSVHWAIRGYFSGKGSKLPLSQQNPTHYHHSKKGNLQLLWHMLEYSSSPPATQQTFSGMCNRCLLCLSIKVDAPPSEVVSLCCRNSRHTLKSK